MIWKQYKNDRNIFSSISFQKFKFGKHNGKSIEEVARTNKGYLEWLAQKLDGDEIDEDWIYTLKHYLGK